MKNNLNSSTWYTEPVDKSLRELYNSLPKEDRIKLKKRSINLFATKFEYLEEILIDYYSAYDIASNIYYEMDFNISKQDLIKLLLFSGIGVAKRTTYEIYLVSGVMEKILEQDKARLLKEYGNNLDKIYDLVMQSLKYSNSIASKNL